MHRRDFFNYGLAIGASSAHFDAWSADKWGSYLGYPTGWAGQFSKLPEYRVGNYSGGFETMFPHHTLAPSDTPLQLAEALIKDFQFSWRLSKKTIGQYLDSWPATGLIICRDSNILFEEYRHQRTAAMRLTSWSMAKSVTSLLLGICLDKKLIRSYDDTPEMYLPELQGTLHGAISLRNLSNMSSGAQILHERDNAIIYPTAYILNTANISKRLPLGINARKNREGRSTTTSYVRSPLAWSYVKLQALPSLHLHKTPYGFRWVLSQPQRGPRIQKKMNSIALDLLQHFAIGRAWELS